MFSSKLRRTMLDIFSVGHILTLQRMRKIKYQVLSHCWRFFVWRDFNFENTFRSRCSHITVLLIRRQWSQMVQAVQPCHSHHVRSEHPTENAPTSGMEVPHWQRSTRLKGCIDVAFQKSRIIIYFQYVCVFQLRNLRRDAKVNTRYNV